MATMMPMRASPIRTGIRIARYELLAVGPAVLELPCAGVVVECGVVLVVLPVVVLPVIVLLAVLLLLLI